MWKKFLAVIGLVGILSTSTAMALGGPNPGGNPPVDDVYFANFQVSPATFNPVKNETTSVSFELKQVASIYAYAISNSTGDIVTTFANFVVTQPGSISYPAWNGKDANGNVLAYGKYTVKAFASVAGAIKEAVQQEVTIANLGPKALNLKAEPTPFSPKSSEDTDIYFDVDKNGFVTVVIKQGATLVREFDGYKGEYYDAGQHSVNWNGKDKDNNVVSDGFYTVEVTASNNDGKNVATTSVETKTTNPVSTGVIKNFSIDPSGKWDPTDGEIEINFELVSEVKSLHIRAEKGNKVIKILDDKVVDDDDYTETWDGTDDDGDYVDEGAWVITLIADGDKATDTVNVKYDQPAIVEAFVTKDSFDPSENESVNLVFKINTKSEVTVEAFQNEKKEIRLLDDELVSKNKWYAVSWSGQDKDGEDVDFGKDWKFKITAKNPTDDDVLAVKNVEFDVEQDDVSDKKSNVTNDATYPVVFDDEQIDTVTLVYTIDEDAAVFVAVYEGLSTGGKAEIELLDYVDQSAGDHTVEWNGKNSKNKSLKDGIYTYKIISKANGNYKETEIGRFVVGNSGDYITDQPPVVKPPVVEPPVVEPPVVEPPFVSQNCGNYIDTKFVANNNYELCAAIDWVTSQGIFNGYADGSFGPYNNIDRGEVLKVVFEAFQNVTILPSDGTNLGFWDLDFSAWYMPYVRTAKFYGMLQGYADGSAGMNRNISRAEFLKFALKASEAFAGYMVPKYSFSYFNDVEANAWYKDFAGVAYEMNLFDLYGKDYVYGAPLNLYPDKPVTRGEVALVLYRMYNNYMLGLGYGFDYDDAMVYPTY